MAAKRFVAAADGDDENQKRMKTRPSFASVITEVVMLNFFDTFCSSLEPMLRTVVSEEVEKGLRRRRIGGLNTLRCPSLKLIQQPPPATATGLRLAFVRNVCLPIFTGTKIADAEGEPLQLILVDHDGAPTSLSYPIKVEIVVVDGDFPRGDHKGAWTMEEFSRNIVRERDGKRPLLAGDLNLTMRDGACSLGDVEFTDNSSWIRSRKFRLAARAVALRGAVVGEAVTEAFVVKDHRGELYKKHHPPALEDEVWRLEKIGKGGAFHQKLSSNAINTVQQFLKLYVVDPSKLRKILGVGMSEKMWEVTLKHAKTCVLGTKLYRCYGNDFTLTFNPICQLIHADFNGHLYSYRDFKNLHTAYIQSLVKDAYAKWHTLEELDGTALILTQGEVVGQYCRNEDQQGVARSSHESDSSNLSVMHRSGHYLETTSMLHLEYGTSTDFNHPYHNNYEFYKISG